MKRTLTLGLSLALAASSALAAVALSACGPVKKEQVELFINVPSITIDSVAYPQYETTDEMIKAMWDSFAAQYKKYDVTLRYNNVNSFEQTAYKQNITDTYGTENCPDLSFGGYFAMSGFMYDGNMIPLDDVITPEIKSDFSDATWSLSQGSNGKTYLMPFFALQNILCYNKDLFREAGLDKYIAEDETIQGWSLDQWEEVLSTLKEKLPSGKYPMMMYAKNNQGDTHTMVQLRAKGSEFFDEQGNFNLNTPEGIAGLQWIKDNYDKGYYPAGCESLEISDISEMFNVGQIALYVWNSALATHYDKLDVGYVNFPAANPEGANSNWITGFMAFDNGDPKKIEVTKDFLRYIYGTPEILDYSTAGVPCSKSVAERFSDKIKLGSQLVANDVYSVDFTASNPNWADVRKAFWPHIQALLTGKETAAEAAAGLDADCNAALKSANRKLHD